MKIITAGMAVLSFVLMCNAATIKYRDGRTAVCDVLAKDDTNLIVRTIKGVQTNTWRQLAPASLKAVHPELFARLQQQARDRQKQQADDMKAKGMILVGGKWVNKKEYEEKARARVHLSVLTTESVGKFERTDKGDGSIDKDYRRESCGVLKIKLDSLDPTCSHSLRVKYTCYVDTPNEADVRVLNKDTEKKEKIDKQHGAIFEFRTEPYYEYKEVLRRGVHYVGGGKSQRANAQIEGWDINIWLDKTLIYEQTRGSKPVYHHVAKW